MTDLIRAATSNQRIAVISAFVAILVFGVVVLGLTKQRKTMELTENNVVTEAATPLTDTSAPTKTATFALG
jgi:hypothetical protein